MKQWLITRLELQSIRRLRSGNPALTSMMEQVYGLETTAGTMKTPER